MPTTETVYARLELSAYQDEFQLNETPSSIHPRLYAVMTDDFYLRKFTDLVAKFQPEQMGGWVKYKQTHLTADRPEIIRAIAKFTVMDQRVDLVEIRFH